MNNSEIEQRSWKTTVTYGLCIAVVVFVAWFSYEYFRIGFHKLPPLSENEFPLALTNGLKGIMVDMEDISLRIDLEEPRKYIGFRAADIPPWYEDAWSRCHAPSEKEAEQISNSFDPGPGARLEAVCSFNTDGEQTHAGIIYSVPDL